LEDEETIEAPGTSAWTAEPTQDLLPSSVEGSSGTGLSQPKTSREDAVNSPGANPIQEMLIINNISCDDAMRTTFTDVKGSRRTVQRNPTNSMTGTFSRLYLKEKS